MVWITEFYCQHLYVAQQLRRKNADVSEKKLVLLDVSVMSTVLVSNFYAMAIEEEAGLISNPERPKLQKLYIQESLACGDVSILVKTSNLLVSTV